MIGTEDIIIDGNKNVATSSNSALINNAGEFVGLTAILQNNKSVNGGAIYNTGKISGPYISIQNNETSGNGGGIYNDGGTVDFKGEIKFNKNYGYDGGGIYSTGGKTIIYNEETLVLENESKYGGGVYVTNGGLLLIGHNAKISKNKSTNQGGGLYLGGGTDTTIYGAYITENISETSDGGGIYINTTTANLALKENSSDRKANVSNNKAKNGGGVYSASANITMNGKIGNNKAKNGGGIYSASTSITMNGIIENNEAYETGGGIYSRAAEITMEDGKIGNNKAHQAGGALYVAANSKAYFKGGVISDNEVLNDYGNGGAIYNRGNAYIQGVNIENNSVKGAGGAIYNAFAMKLSAGTIQNNQASSKGSGVYVSSTSSIFNVMQDIMIHDELYLETGKIIGVETTLNNGCIDAINFAEQTRGVVASKTSGTFTATEASKIKCIKGTLILGNYSKDLVIDKAYPVQWESSTGEWIWERTLADALFAVRGPCTGNIRLLSDCFLSSEESIMVDVNIYPYSGDCTISIGESIIASRNGKFIVQERATLSLGLQNSPNKLIIDPDSQSSGDYDGSLIDVGSTTGTNSKLYINNTIIQNRKSNKSAINIGENGSATITESTISGNTASGGGGGIYNSGTLTITDTTISGNTAPSGGSEGYGGGIYNNGGTLTITESTISGNTAKNGGGGICNTGGTLTITESTISENTAPSGEGGGIYNNGPLTITDTTISGNTASNEINGGNGGGIYNSGDLKITGVEISNNVSYHGGGIYSGDTGLTFEIIGAEISNNLASEGEGIYYDNNLNNLQIRGEVKFDNEIFLKKGRIFIPVTLTTQNPIYLSVENHPDLPKGEVLVEGATADLVQENQFTSMNDKYILKKANTNLEIHYTTYVRSSKMEKPYNSRPFEPDITKITVRSFAQGPIITGLNLDDFEFKYYNKDSDEEISTPVNFGKYDARVKYKGNITEFYTESDFSGKFEIEITNNEDELEIIREVPDKVYDGTNYVNPTVTAKTKEGGEEVAIKTTTYTYYEKGTTQELQGSPKEAGEYRLEIMLTFESYADQIVENEFKITQKEAILNWSGYAEREYDTTASNVTSEVTNKVAEDIVTVEVTGGDKKDAGTYTAQAERLSNANYKLGTIGLTQEYKIKKANSTKLKVDYEVKDKVYDGTKYTNPIVTVKGINDEEVSGKEIKYNYYKGEEQTPLPENPQEVGTYKLEVEVESTNYDQNKTNKPFEITDNTVRYRNKGTTQWIMVKELQDAFNGITIEGEIEILDSVELTKTAVLPQNKKVSLNIQTGNKNTESTEIKRASNFTEGSLIKTEKNSTLILGKDAEHSNNLILDGNKEIESKEAIIKNEGSLEINAQIVLRNNNNVIGNGGGVYNDGELKINGGEIKENKANKGGGIYHDGSKLDINGKTEIENNDIHLTKIKVMNLTGKIESTNNYYITTDEKQRKQTVIVSEKEEYLDDKKIILRDAENKYKLTKQGKEMQIFQNTEINVENMVREYTKEEFEIQLDKVKLREKDGEKIDITKQELTARYYTKTGEELESIPQNVVDYKLKLRYKGNDQQGYNASEETGMVDIKINKKELMKDDKDFAYIYVKEQKYKETEIKPEITVKYRGMLLEEGIDYTVQYKDNIKLGEGRIIITATSDDEGERTRNKINSVNKNEQQQRGNFTGEIELEFEITKSDMELKSEGYKGNYDGKGHKIKVEMITPEKAEIKYGTEKGTYTLEEAPEYIEGNNTTYFRVTAYGYNDYEGQEKVDIKGTHIVDPEEPKQPDNPKQEETNNETIDLSQTQPKTGDMQSMVSTLTLLVIATTTSLITRKKSQNKHKNN